LTAGRLRVIDAARDRDRDRDRDRHRDRDRDRHRVRRVPDAGHYRGPFPWRVPEPSAIGFGWPAVAVAPGVGLKVRGLA